MDNRIEIGREPESTNAIIVPEELNRVSRRHAFIYVQNGTITIEDNRSTNGTFVNGERITKAQVSENDIIWLGGFGADCYRLDVEQIFESCRETGESQYHNGSQHGFATNRDTVDSSTFADQKNQQDQQTNDDKPENYLGLAIVATLFNLIFGIVAIICSVRVNKLWNKGDKEGAEKASNNARRLSIAGLILGIIGIIRIFLFMY